MQASYAGGITPQTFGLFLFIVNQHNSVGTSFGASRPLRKIQEKCQRYFFYQNTNRFFLTAEWPKEEKSGSKTGF